MDLTDDELYILERLVKREVQSWRDMDLLKVAPEYKERLHKLHLKIKEEIY